MANKSSNPGNFANNRERAAEAGRKGGRASGGNFANNPARASEAGRKGGQNSHGTRRPRPRTTPRRPEAFCPHGSRLGSETPGRLLPLLLAYPPAPPPAAYPAPPVSSNSHKCMTVLLLSDNPSGPRARSPCFCPSAPVPMLNNIRIQKKLFAGFAAIIALVVLLLWLTYAALQSLVDANRWDRHTAEVLLSVTALDNNLLETRARLRTFWYSGASADADSARQALTSLTRPSVCPATDPGQRQQQQRFARLSADLDNWRQNTFEPLLRLRETGNLSPAQLANEPLVTALSTQVTNLRQQIQGIGDEERRLSAQRAGHTEEVRGPADLDPGGRRHLLRPAGRPHRLVAVPSPVALDSAPDRHRGAHLRR